MLTYLIILLDDASVSYCHYKESKKKSQVPLETLRDGIIFAMKENLNVQFVYPDYPLPEEYDSVIESIDHAKIKPEEQAEKADVLVLNNWKENVSSIAEGATCVIRANRKELKDNLDTIKSIITKTLRLNIVLTDVETFKDEDIEDYRVFLSELETCILEQYQTEKNVQLNLLTDRLSLTQMNNCNAGVNSITLAPNGCFYLCPAFYYDNPTQSVGNLADGLQFKNRQLLRLDYAPICRHCDAYQCKRCVWLNSKLTLDINTPSHQQCVIAHLERNASRDLLNKFNEQRIPLNETYPIDEIDYLDPFNQRVTYETNFWIAGYILKKEYTKIAGNQD